MLGTPEALVQLSWQQLLGYQFYLIDGLPRVYGCNQTTVARYEQWDASVIYWQAHGSLRRVFALLQPQSIRY